MILIVCTQRANRQILQKFEEVWTEHLPDACMVKKIKYPEAVKICSCISEEGSDLFMKMQCDLGSPLT